MDTPPRLTRQNFISIYSSFTVTSNTDKMDAEQPADNVVSASNSAAPDSSNGFARQPIQGHQYFTGVRPNPAFRAFPGYTGPVSSSRTSAFQDRPDITHLQPSTAEQMQLPSFAVPEDEYIRLEHPCIVKDVDRAIQSLGGSGRLDKVRESPFHSMLLILTYFRPSMKPILGEGWTRSRRCTCH